MSNVAHALQRVHARIREAALSAGRNPDAVRLLAVSKTKPAAMVREAYRAGQRAFGENYLQDALPKLRELADLDIEWHYIGRIQSNKTREIAEHFAWVHGLDRLKHARRLSEQRPAGLGDLNCCIQVNLSGEQSKGGVSPAELPELAAQVDRLPRLRLRGLMTMPDPHSPRAAQLAAFEGLAGLRDRLKTAGLDLDTLSMGMSGDLELAVAAGSTLVRIGTDIFGARN
jgi:pyridoxal phosphate enzyme (YggS family)